MHELTVRLKDLIVAKRKVAGLTQHEVSQRIKVSLRTYQRFESGDTPVPLAEIIKIFDLLKIPLKTLLEQIELSNHEIDKGDFSHLKQFIDFTNRRSLSDGPEISHTDLSILKNLVYTPDQIAGSTIGYWEWNVVAGSFYWSDELYKIYQIRPRDIEASIAMTKFIHPEDLLQINRSLGRLIDKGIPYVNIHRYQKDEQTSLVHAFGFKYVNSSNEVILYGPARLVKPDEGLEATTYAKERL